eukprot:5857628-Amphidinium_carterae.1
MKCQSTHLLQADTQDNQRPVGHTCGVETGLWAFEAEAEIASNALEGQSHDKRDALSSVRSKWRVPVLREV